MKFLIPASKRRDLNTNEHDYLSHWLCPVIREMVTLPNFKDDPYWISRRINGQVKVSEIQNVLNFLKDEGFVKKTDDGYEAVDNMVFSSDEVISLAIRNYHREMLGQAKHSLESLAIDEREFGAIIFSLPDSAMGELKRRIKKFRDEVHEWACNSIVEKPGDRVMQLNIQMYPHTKKVEGGE